MQILGRLFVTSSFLLCSLSASAQIPDTFTNLQFHPKDTSRAELMDVMRHFSFALGVRCQHCHVGGDGESFEGVAFDKDSPNKEKARFMLGMTRDLNESVLPELPGRDEAGLRIECKTCHRGQPTPALLTQAMRTSLADGGADAAVARYRELRSEFESAGAFDFGEWEVNAFAESLASDERSRDAIAIYELNAEFYPGSMSIHWALGNLYEEVDDTAAAIRSYERVLELRPEFERAQQRLDALR